MKMYHYARLGDWNKIKTRPTGSGELGLVAKRKIGREYEEALNTRAGFALFEPVPKDWEESEFFEDIFSRLKRDVGELLLEIDVDPEDEDVFVIDRGYLEGYLYDDKTKIPDRYREDNRKRAEKAYLESKVPLKRYLEEKDTLHFSLPEIIFHKTIPPERIRISDFQPGLMEMLEGTRGVTREAFVREIIEIPELSQWYEKYERDKEAEAELLSANQPKIPFR